jgi:hypothetical protein
MERTTMLTRNMRYLAVAGAAAAALLYFLIGFEVLTISKPTSGTGDILGFGLSAGTAFAVIAVLVALVHKRWVLALVALFDAAVIVAYFAFADLRDPPFEPWGLLVKVAQAVLLVGVGSLLLQAREQAGYSRSMAHPVG